MAYWSGRKTAEAVADVLTGEYNPDGRLPYSYPRSSGENFSVRFTSNSTSSLPFAGSSA